MFKSTERAIREYFDDKIDEDTRRLINVATFDLYYGPAGAYEPDGDGWEYPGWETAIGEIRARLDIGDLFVDEDDYVTDTEPQAWTDEDGGDHIPEYFYVDARTVKRIVFGALAEYL